MNQPTQHTPAPAGSSPHPQPAFRHGALAASALILAGLLVVEAGKRNFGNVALAGDAASVADLSVLTAAAGPDEDVMCVLDQRAETLSVFGVEQGRSVQLFQALDLKQAFVQSRGGNMGR